MNLNHMDLLVKPTGHNMDVMAERFMHIINKINPGSITTLLEIGSMDAWESINMARVFEDATVHTFEPVPLNFQACQDNLVKQPKSVRDRIHLHQIAMNDLTGPMEFWALDVEEAARVRNKLNHGIASKYQLIDPDMWPWEHNKQKSITVSGYRLDDWCQENHVDRVDGIWMDAQGAELDILKGAKATLEKCAFVMTEAGLKPYYHGHTMKTDMDSLMSDLGFVEWYPATKQAHEYEVDMIYLNKRFAVF